MVLGLDGERVASITGFAGGTRHLNARVRDDDDDNATTM